MQNPSILNLQQVKQFQVRRPQITKGSPLLKGNQIQIAGTMYLKGIANIRNQSLLSDQPQHLKIKQQEEQELGIHNQFERRIQKQNQYDIKQQDNIFQLKLSNEHQLNQLNMQLIKKNKILSNRLQQQYKINESYMEQINKLQETNQAYEMQIHQLEEKIKKQKSKKKQLKEQIDQLQQELDEMQEKYQNNSNQDMNQEDEQQQQQQQQQQQNHIPLTRQQLYQLMQYLYQGDQQQIENFHEYQDQEIDPDAMTYEQLLELEEQIGNVPKGLTKQQIKQLPKRTLDQDNIPEDKCSVCLFEFKEEEKVRELPCKHIYHSSCIKNWLQNNKQCPLCKTEIEIQINESDEQLNQQDEQDQENEQQDELDQQQSEIE